MLKKFTEHILHFDGVSVSSCRKKVKKIKKKKLSTPSGMYWTIGGLSSSLVSDML